MSNIENGVNGHERFAELCAVASSGRLSKEESLELKQHLARCYECRQLYSEFTSLARDGMSLLGSDYEITEVNLPWDQQAAHRRLRATMGLPTEKAEPAKSDWFLGVGLVRLAVLSVCAVLVIGGLGYAAGKRRANAQHTVVDQALPPSEASTALSKAKDALRIKAAELTSAERAAQSRKMTIIELESKLEVAKSHILSVEATNSGNSEELLRMSSDREALTAQLQEARERYRNVELELNTIREEHNQDLLRIASLESGNQELSDQVREQERVIAARDQYLSSDRDIRELMGARQLYIADVFDVDGSGRARRPFGRVFYTKSKSLVFYAFDLDQQPEVKNANAFQVWGQRDFGHVKPLSLGIMYMDSTTNRRWVLRFDDPVKLADIDAVFVTVEPNGGSSRPTGKQLLYASLRKTPNHP